MTSNSTRGSKALFSFHEVAKKDDLSMWWMTIMVGDGGRTAKRKKKHFEAPAATLRRCEHQLQMSHLP